MKFTALEHKEQLSRSFLIPFATTILFKLPVPYLRKLWSPLYKRSHNPGRIKGFPEELQPDSLNPWQTSQAKGTASSPPQRFCVLLSKPFPKHMSWLDEHLGWGGSTDRHRPLLKFTTRPHCFETFARTSNPVKKQHVELSILLEVSASHPNLLSTHAQMGPGQYLTCHQCTSSTFLLASGLEHFPRVLISLLWHLSVLCFTCH